MEKIDNEYLVRVLEEGDFFNFCCGVAINNGFSNIIREKKSCRFRIGDYEVTFVAEKPFHFQLVHKIYFARIIHAFYNEAHFIGDDEKWVIDDVLSEFKKDIE